VVNNLNEIDHNSDMNLEEKVKKKLKEGWIKAWMMIEVLAVTEDAARSSLEKHVKRMESEDGVIIYTKKFHDIKKVENPLPRVSVGFSNVVELETVVKNFDKLVYLAMNYAPSSIEILEPGKIEIDAGEAQGIVNSIADLVHKFAAAGIGGVVIQS